MNYNTSGLGTSGLSKGRESVYGIFVSTEAAEVGVSALGDAGFTSYEVSALPPTTTRETGVDVAAVVGAQLPGLSSAPANDSESGEDNEPNFRSGVTGRMLESPVLQTPLENRLDLKIFASGYVGSSNQLHASNEPEYSAQDGILRYQSKPQTRPPGLLVSVPCPSWELRKYAESILRRSGASAVLHFVRRVPVELVT